MKYSTWIDSRYTSLLRNKQKEGYIKNELHLIVFFFFFWHPIHSDSPLCVN